MKKTKENKKQINVQIDRKLLFQACSVYICVDLLMAYETFRDKLKLVHVLILKC